MRKTEDEERQGVIRGYIDPIRASIRPTIDVLPQVLVETRPWARELYIEISLFSR